MNQSKIYDIAGAAGVSLATVSRVLNHPEKVKNKSTKINKCHPAQNGRIDHFEFSRLFSSCARR